jgi:hypothetical protein
VNAPQGLNATTIILTKHPARGGWASRPGSTTAPSELVASRDERRLDDHQPAEEGESVGPVPDLNWNSIPDHDRTVIGDGSMIEEKIVRRHIL